MFRDWIAAAATATVLALVQSHAHAHGGGFGYHPYSGHSHYAPTYKDGKLYRDPEVAREFQRLRPCPSTGRMEGACPGFVRDHIQPLCAGGADSVANIQWQEFGASLIKDEQERALCRSMHR
jgi:hypothetical protein